MAIQEAQTILTEMRAAIQRLGPDLTAYEYFHAVQGKPSALTGRAFEHDGVNALQGKAIARLSDVFSRSELTPQHVGEWTTAMRQFEEARGQGLIRPHLVDSCLRLAEGIAAGAVGSAAPVAGIGIFLRP